MPKVKKPKVKIKPEDKNVIDKRPINPPTPSEKSRDIALEFERRSLPGFSRREEKARLQQDPETIAQGVEQTAAPVLEEFGYDRGVLEQPKATQLDVEQTTGFIGDVPIVGPSLTALRNILIKQSPREPLINDPDTIRQAALQRIQRGIIEDGLTSREKFGTLVESIPIAGSLVSNYASGLIETPRGNAATILSTIAVERDRALNAGEMVRSGRLSPTIALETLNDVEENVTRLEQRLKLLIEASPILQADADTINKFEEEILRVRERVRDVRQTSFDIIRDPTNGELLQQLMEAERQRGNVDNDN